MPARSFADLREDKPTQLIHIRNHCRGTHIPSSYISTSDDVAWVYKTTRKKFPDGQCTQGLHEIAIAFVSVHKLAHLNIPYDRSDIRVKTVGGQSGTFRDKDGVDFAWSKHWLVYGWIPTMCIIKVLTASQFWNLSEAFVDLNRQ